MISNREQQMLGGDLSWTLLKPGIQGQTASLRNLYIERTLAINKTGFKMRTTWDTEKIRTDYER